MNCTQCGEHVPPGNYKYFVIFDDAGKDGFRLEVACPHRVPEGHENALAILSSIDCLMNWLTIWIQQRNCSQHKK